MAKLCKSCGGLVCYMCGGCINHGECSKSARKLLRASKVALEQMDYVTNGWPEWRGCRFSWAANQLRAVIEEGEKWTTGKST